MISFKFFIGALTLITFGISQTSSEQDSTNAPKTEPEKEVISDTSKPKEVTPKKEEPKPEKKEAAPVNKVAAPPPPLKQESPALKEESKEKPKQEESKAEEEGSKESQSSEEGEESGGLTFSPGLSVGTMTRNGNTWTRFSFRPEFAIGKLGVALDMEIFINERQEFDSYGWNFGSFDEGMESILRKIYYVRWAQPGDPIYLKVGALDNLTIGYGLAMGNYSNTPEYPNKKLIGFHGQVNNLPIMNLGFEFMFNSFHEITKTGSSKGQGVMAGRAHVSPLFATGMPLFKNLSIGAAIISDRNQLGNVDDTDGDNCPDPLDADLKDARLCIEAEPIDDTVAYSPTLILRDLLVERQRRRDLYSQPIKDRIRDGDAFSMLTFDAGMPIITTPLLKLNVYSELALRVDLDGEEENFFQKGYGLILPGARAKLLMLTASLEYRFIKTPFYQNYFNQVYELQRNRYDNGSLETGEQFYWKSQTAGELAQGIYGSAGVDLKSFFTVGASYEMLFPTEGDKIQNYSSSIALGKTLTDLIPKISSGKIYWIKNRVGEDRDDGFFDTSLFTRWGYAMGFDMGANMTIIVNSINTYHRVDGKLEKQNNLALETAVRF